MSENSSNSNLPDPPLDDLNEPPPNPARAVQSFAGEVMAVASKPVDIANLGWDSDVLRTEQRDEKFDEYIFELDSYVPLCRFDEEGFETYHNDQLGTSHELTDEGNITWSGIYDIYGSISGRYIGESDNRIRFQGQYADTEIGLHYNCFRYYDPELGRYINQDPVGLVGGLNQYEYTQNPLNWTDPLGLSGRGD